MDDERCHAPGLVVIGGGPAGLMAAEVARGAGVEVDLYEGKGSVGRKFLIAGKGGLNLTHAEPSGQFVGRYRGRERAVGEWLARFDARDLREWAKELGIETFVGTSGRVFPLDLKAAPMLRAWVRRLRDEGVRFHVQHRWRGWDSTGALVFDSVTGVHRVEARSTVLALGGGSWPQLGSDGAWQTILRSVGTTVHELKPANCGFDIRWSGHFATRHAGAPLKPVIAHWRDPSSGREQALQGECVVTGTGIEGSLIYALSGDLRDTIDVDGEAVLQLDLAPGRDALRLRQDLERPRGSRSASEHLRRQTGLTGAKAALLYEVLGRDGLADTDRLVETIKRLPLRLTAPRPLPEVISSAGGVDLRTMNSELMLDARPGVFCAGEMLDWEAPTGGYLLTACFASGVVAGRAAADWLTAHEHGPP
jgi:uncharacterized flavoprotein (TIGR03862 family)